MVYTVFMPPPHYPARVKTLIARLDTPEKVQHWLQALKYNQHDTMRTLPEMVRHGRVHCLEGAMAAAAILEHHGFPPLILDLESADLLDHTLFVYRRCSRWGAVGKSRDIGLDGRKPVFKTIRALVMSYAAPYIDARARITRFGLLDLRTLPNERWKTSNRNVWYVEEALRHVPHARLNLPKSFVTRWRKKYIVFKKKHPGQQPDYFPAQQSWY